MSKRPLRGHRFESGISLTEKMDTYGRVYCINLREDRETFLAKIKHIFKIVTGTFRTVNKFFKAFCASFSFVIQNVM